MEVAFRCGTLAEVGHSNSVVTIHAISVAGAGGLGHLCAQGRGHSDDVHVTRAIMDRHLLAAAQIILITGQLVSHLLDRETAPEESTSLAILREDKVIIVECGPSANARSNELQRR